MDSEQANKQESEEQVDVAKEVILAAQGRAPNGQLMPGCPPNNPSGRPKSKPFRDALLRHFAKNPEQLDAIIARAAAGAEAGNETFFKELRDMLDGKPAIAVTGEEGGPLQVEHHDARSKLLADLGA